jgi:peptidoglycan hydrolase-like protein with peptidoglycan-binding domain
MFNLRAPIVVSQPRRRVAERVLVGKLYSVNEQVQASLIWLGYDLGADGADGAIGSKSKAAIIAFKKAHGLSPEDATITEDLMKELIAAVAAKPATDPATPAPKDTYHPPAEPTPAPKTGVSGGTIAVIIIAVLAVGAGIYAVAT